MNGQLMLDGRSDRLEGRERREDGGGEAAAPHSSGQIMVTQELFS